MSKLSLRFVIHVVLLGFTLQACNKDDSGSNNTSTPGYLNPSLTYGSVTDIDDNRYATIVIGTQEWMAQNLRTSRYANGDTISNVTDNAAWTVQTEGAWAHYENRSSNNTPFGKLYNGYTVIDTRNVCPTGWHVPTVADWTLLIDYLGGDAVVGDKLKATGTAYWLAPNTYATNESGFSALPGGFRTDYDATFNALDTLGNWWSATDDGGGGLMDYVINTGSGINSFGDAKSFGCSVRCVRD
jgi:uncharacterized protein (TIGR02145 family)